MFKQRIIYFFIATALLLVACNNEDYNTKVGEGTVLFSCEAKNDVAQVLARSTSQSDYVVPDSLIPDVDLCKLNIIGTYLDKETNTNMSYDSVFNTLSEYNQNVPYLTSGNYTAIFTYGDVSLENDTNACFSGSVDFTIVARKSITKEVNAKLCNSVIRLKTTTEFNNYFKDALFQVVTANGATLNFTANDSLVYFVEAESALTLSGTAKKRHNNAVVSFSAKELSSTTSATTMSTIVIDSEKTGGMELNVTLDGIETTVILDVQELNPNA